MMGKKKIRGGQNVIGNFPCARLNVNGDHFTFVRRFHLSSYVSLISLPAALSELFFAVTGSSCHHSPPLAPL
jgi:hypothetical protein